jgi:bacterial/archaeal transporter family protein
MNNWLAWSLLAAFFAGATAVLAKIGVTGVDSNFATAIRTTVVLLFTWMIASFSWVHWSFGNVSFRTWLFLILSGLAAGLSWLCYFRALQLGEPSRVAPMDKLSVFFAISSLPLFSRNANVASLAWRRTCADRRGHPCLQMMKGVGMQIG